MLLSQNIKFEKENKCEREEKVIDNENDEVINVGWDIYFKYFFSSQIWVSYLLSIPIY